MALTPGQLVGPYQVIGQLGHGGMATVYKAYHPRLDRYVAIKVMHKAFTEDAGFIARATSTATRAISFSPPPPSSLTCCAFRSGR